MSQTLPPSPTEPSPAVYDALRRSDLFASLSEPSLRLVAALSTMRKVRRTDRLYGKGTPGESVVVVVEGRVKCCMPGEEPRNWVSAVVRAGGACGLAACVDGGTHTCNADPMERSRVVVVPAAAVREAMTQDAEFARHVATSLAGQARRALAACEDVVLRTPLERLARYLASQPAPDGVMELRDTQTQIAAQLGTVREVVGRAFRRLQARGVVSRRGRIVHVLLPLELTQIAKTTG